MKTTFLNGDAELEKRGREYLKSTMESVKKFMNAEDLEDVEDIGSYYEWGLYIDYVAPGTFEDEYEGYLRYQLSWGGPGDEIRFYFTPSCDVCYKIEYVFLDWGEGVGFDVTKEDWAKWLFDDLHETETDMFEFDKAMKTN